MRTSERRVNHCLVKPVENIRAGRAGLVHWLTGARGEEQPSGEPYPMFNAYEKGVKAGRLCIAVQSPDLAADHLGAVWKIVCPKKLGPPTSTECVGKLVGIDAERVA